MPFVRQQQIALYFKMLTKSLAYFSVILQDLTQPPQSAIPHLYTWSSTLFFLSVMCFCVIRHNNPSSVALVRACLFIMTVFALLCLLFQHQKMEMCGCGPHAEVSF